jgi:hypothetical protein
MLEADTSIKTVNRRRRTANGAVMPPSAHSDAAMVGDGAIYCAIATQMRPIAVFFGKRIICCISRAGQAQIIALAWLASNSYGK